MDIDTKIFLTYIITACKCNKNGYIYMTQQKIYENTQLSSYKQQKILEELEAQKIITRCGAKKSKTLGDDAILLKFSSTRWYTFDY